MLAFETKFTCFFFLSLIVVLSLIGGIPNNFAMSRPIFMKNFGLDFGILGFFGFVWKFEMQKERKYFKIFKKCILIPVLIIYLLIDLIKNIIQIF